MAKKILTGDGYTQPRLAGILHETFVARKGSIVPSGNVTVYGEGSFVTNKNTQALGLVLDTDSEYFSYLPEVHSNRLIDYIETDWE